MRNLKILMVGLMLAFPGLAAADASNIPGTAAWYLHVDLQRMKSEEAGKVVYGWMIDEIFNEVKTDAGVDIENELDRVTAFSVKGKLPVMLFEGDFSQATRDKVMTFVAANGDITPQKASGKTYYRISGGGKDSGAEESPGSDGGTDTDNFEAQFESLAEEAWISVDFKKRIVVTSGEEQMRDLLARDGKIAGSRSHGGALLVLTAEKSLIQGGMNTSLLGESDDDDSGWNSNILRNTEQVAFMVAAVANKLAVEARLVTTEPEMAQSLASVVRGLISLLSFDDSMDSKTKSVLQGTRVEASGNNLNISLALDPALVVATLND